MSWLEDYPEEVRWERDLDHRSTALFHEHVLQRGRHRDPHTDTVQEGEHQPERFPRSLEAAEAAVVEVLDCIPDPNEDWWEAEVIRRGTSPGYIHHPEPSHLHYQGPTLRR